MWRNIVPFLSKIKKIFVYGRWVGGRDGDGGVGMGVTSSGEVA